MGEPDGAMECPPNHWQFEPKGLRLLCLKSEARGYAIDLTRITSSACMLDVLFETSARKWATTAVVGELVKNLQALFDPQMTLCGGGRDRKLNPQAYLRDKEVH